MRSDMTRRGALAALTAGAGAAILPIRARALTTTEARSLIGRVVAAVNRVINSGEPEPRMYADFRAIFVKYADVDVVARSVLGPPWRTASPAQRRAFTDAFVDYIAVKYGSRFREFVGGQLKVRSARPIKSFYAVTATALLRGEAPFQVTFLVSDKSGENQFFNMLVEGVNMRATEATEIGAMLDRRGGDLDALIRDLRAAV